MAIKITKLSPFMGKIWPATCPTCKTEFTYQYPDIETSIPLTLYTPPYWFVRCPYCNSKISVELPEIDDNGN
jgi:DNA-directed RNA polymerase subunit RPC12/RpoP